MAIWTQCFLLGTEKVVYRSYEKKYYYFDYYRCYYCRRDVHIPARIITSTFNNPIANALLGTNPFTNPLSNIQHPF